MPRMARKLEEIFQEAAKLPDRDRAELAGLLLDSLESQPDPEVEATWAEEVERRIRQIDGGEVELIPWEQVRAELFRRSRGQIVLEGQPFAEGENVTVVSDSDEAAFQVSADE